MTEEEIKKELEEIYSWKRVTTGQVKRVYEVYKVIFNDHQKHCPKCPSVITKIINKVKRYYEENYK